MNSKYLKIIIIVVISFLGIIFYFSVRHSGRVILRPNIQQVVDSMQNLSFQGSNLNMMGRKPIPSSQFARFVYLCDSATTDELILLTEHKSSVVRCYAFDALSERGLSNFIQLLQSHIDDTSRFEIQYFDMIDYTSVSLHLKFVTLNNYLEKCEPIENNYSFIRSLAITTETPNAVIALSKYKRIGDEDIINRYLAVNDARLHRYGLMAAREFPSELLYDSLVKLYKMEIAYEVPLLLCFPLYQSLAQYEKSECQSFFIAALSKPDKYHMRKIALYVALNKYPTPFYYSILSRIELTEFDKKLLDEYKYYYN